MSAKYLLPCRCGQQIVVEPRQAGETIVCSCGASLQAPTMLGILSLEPAPPEPAPATAKTHWGLAHRMLLLGIAFVLASLLGGVVLYLTRPIAPSDVIEPEQIRATISQFSPTRTWEIWESMKLGLGRTDPRYAAAVLQHHVWLGVAGLAALAGVALVVVGLTTGRAAPVRAAAASRAPDDV